jgi:pyroglutamyl-peptidase
VILVTGFKPYKEEHNASGELIDSLNQKLTDSLLHVKDQIHFETIEVDTTSRKTEHQNLEDQLLKLLKEFSPRICIFTGQAPPCNKVTIEKVGLNTFMSEQIDNKRSVAYWADLPGIETLKEKIEAHDIPAAYSYYAGQSLCNHILYSSLYFAEKYNLTHKSGFIHIPLLPKQVTQKHRDRPSMPIEITRRSLSVIINHAYEAQQD